MPCQTWAMPVDLLGGNKPDIHMCEVSRFTCLCAIYRYAHLNGCRISYLSAGMYAVCHVCGVHACVEHVCSVPCIGYDMYVPYLYSAGVVWAISVQCKYGVCHVCTMCERCMCGVQHACQRAM